MAEDRALKRAQELMHTPQVDVPPLAMEFLRKLASEVGCCMEVCLTAFAIYAQCVEGLQCDDDLYQASPVERRWFAERTTDE